MLQPIEIVDMLSFFDELDNGFVDPINKHINKII